MGVPADAVLYQLLGLEIQARGGRCFTPTADLSPGATHGRSALQADSSQALDADLGIPGGPTRQDPNKKGRPAGRPRKGDWPQPYFQFLATTSARSTTRWL